LFSQRLKGLFRSPDSAHLPGSSGAAELAGIFPVGRSQSQRETDFSRMSRGLEQFFTCIREETGLTILDLGGASQANVEFITNLGHRLYSQNFLRSLEETFGGEDLTEQSNSGQIDYFLGENLDFPDESFDGVLVWDVLEYLAPPLLTATVERLFRTMKPKSYLLALFHFEGRLESVPYYSFRIQDFNTLQVAPNGNRPLAQLFNNRGLEKVFQHFESVKFFLTRDHLREVIVRR
jgi:hypothetical protein